MLADAILAALPAEIAPKPLIMFCDRTEDDEFQRFAGLTSVGRAIAIERPDAYPAILLLGLFPKETKNYTSEEKELEALLQWPGIAYLQYGFTREELITKARRAAEGAKTPVPPKLLRTAIELVRDDLTRLVEDLHHWLNGRLNNTEGALKGFRNAARGAVELDPGHLKPLMAISGEHQRVLDRFCKRKAEIERFAPRSGGVEPMKAAVEQFKEQWEKLEVARAALRSRIGPIPKELLRDVVHKLESVRGPLASAFAIVDGLQQELATDE
jgi:hypothetical protein